MALLKINRGTDIKRDFEYVDADGLPIDMAGFTFSVFEASSEIAGLISISETDLAGGVVSIRVEWANTLSSGIKHEFRIIATLGEDDIGSELVEVLYL
jgi:hypothetical protein